jgi:hypothetical protein
MQARISAAGHPTGIVFMHPERPHAPTCLSPQTPVTETSGVRIAGLGSIKQVEIAFDRVPQFMHCPPST